MSRLAAHHFLPETNLAGEIQVELTWECLDIGRGDWASVGAAMDAGKLPMRQHKEVRSYANREMAERAIANLQQNKKSA